MSIQADTEHFKCNSMEVDMGMLELHAERQARLLLRQSNLRPTKHRIAIAAWLFGSGKPKHATAEGLYRALSEHDHSLSLATIYNTLHAFTECGLLKRRFIGPDAAIYDTSTEPHHHLLIEDTGEIRDIAYDDIVIKALPQLPAGLRLASVDIILRAETGARPGQA